MPPALRRIYPHVEVKRLEEISPLNTIIGIDLGTTYSRAAVVRHGNVSLIFNQKGQEQTQSLVSFSPEEVLVGEATQGEDLIARHTIFNFKRMIGCSYTDLLVQDHVRNWPFRVLHHEDRPFIPVTHKGKDLKLIPQDLSSFLLMRMRTIADNFLGQEVVSGVVLSVPSSFTEEQRDILKIAAEEAKLRVVNLINEPTAAAIAYLCSRPVVATQRNILVYSFGGGFCEATAFQTNATGLLIRGSSGTNLGGADFDNRLVSHFVDEIQRGFGLDVIQDPDALHQLNLACEAAKRRLSESESTIICMPDLIGEQEFTSQLTRTTFRRLCIDLLGACIEPVRRCLNESDLQYQDIDVVVMVGGSTHVPQVREALINRLPDAEFAEINPDEAVAYGTACAAGMHFRPTSGPSSRRSSTASVTPSLDTQSPGTSKGQQHRIPAQQVRVRENSFVEYEFETKFLSRAHPRKRTGIFTAYYDVWVNQITTHDPDYDESDLDYHPVDMPVIDLSDHLEGAASGTKPQKFHCPFCYTCFSRRFTCIRHMNGEHRPKKKKRSPCPERKGLPSKAPIDCMGETCDCCVPGAAPDPEEPMPSSGRRTSIEIARTPGTSSRPSDEGEDEETRRSKEEDKRARDSLRK